ncbi:M23 family metallopeptidase [Salinarimonas ramus]|uniref:M23ase beta-sheet core domain-containing protein n=1 Tax=Salinarimonas ramus TaxID=690164 RepID=A0A917QCR7_9HYPH|nr:M23 family metallopeptidase [Salinarimonas ramus]GGK44793.1 hypothetical protein GCM10011322_34980 [Salinarimonas ramus]
MIGAAVSLVVLQVLVPLALVVWIGLAPPGDAASLVATIGFGGAYLLVVSSVGNWALVPRPVLVVLVVAFWIAALLAVIDAWPAGRIWPDGLAERAATAFVALLAVALGWLVLSLADARRAPEGPVAQIAFPLAGGRFIVGSGGHHDLLNPHRKVLEPERAHLRGQAHAIDFLGLDGLGLRARGLHPADPTAYAIFGKPVLAPCAGRVVEARDGLPDLPPPHRDAENLAGNHVLIACEGFDVLLAHLQHGSLRVQVGDAVSTGDVIGRVGNSGNTTEPHLHVHAQRGSRRRHLLDADPIPMTIHGRHLVRNDVIETD